MLTTIKAQALILIFLVSTLSLAESPPIRDSFERISPKQAGYSETALGELRDYLKKSGSSSLLLLHDGKVFFEWGDIYKRHLIHSVRKSLMNSLMGTLYDQRKLNLKATLKQLKVNDSPDPLTEEELQATIEMVLKSRSGIYHAATAESEDMKLKKPKRGLHSPGETYYYNNWDFNLAGMLFEKLSGEKVFDAFYERIAQPLGMKQFKNQQSHIDLPYEGPVPLVDGIYQFELQITQYPAYHFRMSAHDLALYGQLFLNQGEWNGKQILSKEWIELSTKPYSVTNQRYGLAYGMLWNVLLNDIDDSGRYSFYHTGVGVHMLGVYPKHKLVMVHRVDTENESVRFKVDNLYSIIRMMHQARSKKTKENDSKLAK
ncbi:MAG: beta-lactamase family protein [Kangiellaceae bacterium]|nr:beta-lactamase family protein [Kangiellaceae bacterium]MCW8997799.1 beta-lactamase family protein [Kangiellaceae bacterium]